MTFHSGLPAVDRYLDHGFHDVRGMSSRFAAAICARLLAIQSEAGISGGAAEIGTFEGRFFIALAKAMRKGEPLLGIDSFDWPDDGIMGRFLANAALHGLSNDGFETLKIDSRTLKPDDILARTNGPLRFIHVDGEHTDDHLSRDIKLAHDVTAERGLIVLDDMLHPGYPTLILTVQTFLDANSDMRVVAIIDREDIVAAPKFVLCRTEMVPFYDAALREAFPQATWPMTADFRTYQALVLTPNPILAKID
ncbi:MAG: class I SAM-dependent methyltransferase [Beijerinckiaceae bacterium]|nr:class I SAM-dependent methyltransferase [Beijerinckiaceae bacterium]